MSPPTEQLIRDYLNRLSVAARDRMSPDERRALVDRTRKLIERRADVAGRPTTLEVGKVLARLGDPAGLVERELRRRSTVRGNSPVRAAAETVAAESGSRGFLAWVLRRDQVRTEQTGWPADWRRPSDPVAPADEGQTPTDRATPGADAGVAAPALIDEPSPEVRFGAAEAAAAEAAAAEAAAADHGTASSVPTAPAAGPSSGRPQQASDDSVHNGTTRAAGPRPLRPQWPSLVARDGSHDYGRDQDEAGEGLPVPNGRVGGGRTAGDVAATGRPEPHDGETDSGTVGVRANWQLEKPAAPVLGVMTRRVVGRVRSWARLRPLEAVAVVLLGLGGVIYPPVFLLGAVVALGSRLWDYRDKWIGLVLPVVLTVIGLAAGIAAGGRHYGLHDGWVYLNIISRLAALLGAGYLAWRSTHGRREPSEPPWNKAHRVG